MLLFLCMKGVRKTQINLFKNIRKKETISKGVKEYFSFINGYNPVHTSFEGGLYEMELTRACIHSFATHASKFHPEVTGQNNNKLVKVLQNKPNELMNTSQFIARIATMYQAENTAFIVPLFDDYLNMIGYYPLSTNKCQIRKENGVAYLTYDFINGHKESVELSKVGRMIQHQFNDEIFGESNTALRPTMKMIHAQNEAIIESARNNASIRFLGKLAQVLDNEDIIAEQERLKKDSLGSSNNGGVLLFDNKYQDIKQIDSKPYIVSQAQQQIIKDNVYSYFHTNDAILTNNFTESQFNAYYEGCLEPFGIQLGHVLSNMTFTDKEFSFGNEILFSSNRLQYSNLSDKVSYATQLFDRGILSQDDIRDIFQLARWNTDDSNKPYIRKEYAKVEDLNKDITEKEGEKENATT